MLIKKGPLTVAVNVNWLGDDKEVLYCESSLNYDPHGMILVGYNDTGQYWILKNSWGIGWGHNGYAYIRYGNCWIESDNQFIYPENVSLVSFPNESNWKNFVTVCKNEICDFKTIQEAVEAVCSGGKIFINDSSAVFNEEIDILMDNMTVDCNNATIDGNNTKDVGIWITAKNVTVKNCIVKNFVSSGFWLYYSSNNVLTNNTANNNNDGILLWDSSNNVLTNNTAKNYGEGIHLLSSSNNILTNNTASNNKFGIYLGWYSFNNILNGNHFCLNTK